LVNKYGEKAYRRWEVFLAWSVRVARQGSSTLFTFTLTKAQREGRRIETQNHLVPRKPKDSSVKLNQTGFETAEIELNHNGNESELGTAESHCMSNINPESLSAC